MREGEFRAVRQPDFFVGRTYVEKAQLVLCGQVADRLVRVFSLRPRKSGLNEMFAD